MNEDIKQLSKHARSLTGLSQVKFAKKYGIAVNTLRDCEQGRHTPSFAFAFYNAVIREYET